MEEQGEGAARRRRDSLRTSLTPPTDTLRNTYLTYSPYCMLPPYCPNQAHLCFFHSSAETAAQAVPRPTAFTHTFKRRPLHAFLNSKG